MQSTLLLKRSRLRFTMELRLLDDCDDENHFGAESRAICLTRTKWRFLPSSVVQPMWDQWW